MIASKLSCIIRARPFVATPGRKSSFVPACKVRRASLDPVSQDSSPTQASLPSVASLALAAPFLLHVQDALAADGAYGILEGRTAALVHPAVMFFLFAATGYAGFLGWQWRRTREVGEEIRALKKNAPAGADGEAPTDPKIVALESERKQLVAGNYRDKHAVWGSILLGSGVLIAVEGAVNTWFRTGKLFPGPHLFAGAGMVVIWALAASLVPAMQKGNDSARSVHIALNAVNVGLFIWQVPTGLDIVGKVFQFTQWP